jgi:hypothetical protein
MVVQPWIRALAFGALLVAGCGSVNSPAARTVTPAPGISSAPTATPTAAASPAPVNACGSSNRCLALVTLRGSNRIVVRDITDISHPTTVSSFAALDWPQFVNGNTLSNVVSGTSLFRASLSGSSSVMVARTAEQFMAYTWSPDGGTVAYLAPNSSGMALHLVSGGQDRLVDGAIPALPAVGCEYEPCPGADTWDFRLSYSPDGAFISLVMSIAGASAFRLWSSDGKVLQSSDSQPRGMSTWSGAGFYFPDAKGIEVIRAASTSLFLSGVSWIHPQGSPDGKHIVYETRDSQGWHHTFVVDTDSQMVRELTKGRTQPLFLTSRFVWARGEGSPGISNGNTYLYDLQQGTESPSIITQVFDVWPHAA